MMRMRNTAVTLSVAFLLALAALCQPANAAGRFNVVASTTLLRSAVRDVGRKHVSTSVLIAPGSCPGHYDLNPEDLRKLSSSKLVLTHGYECFVDNILKSMGKSRPRLIKIPVTGNWMVPSVYVSGAERVADALCKADPKHSADYRKALLSLKTRAAKLSTQLRGGLKTSGASGMAVLCSNQQAPFVRWMGFKVVGAYARAEEFTPAELHRLASTGRKRGVRLVIDNLQSGPTAGKQLARDIGAAHVTLSNFPGGFARTDTWSACLRDNVRRVLEILGR